MSTPRPNPYVTAAKVLAGLAVVGLTGFAITRRMQKQKQAGGCCGCSKSAGAGAAASASAAASSSPAAAAAAGARKPRVVFVLGGPGAGKGTQCARIVDRFGFVHLSAGDLLRAEREKGGETGEMIDRLIREGQIVPVKVTLDLLRAAMEDNMAQGRFLFLIDGFPRNQDNLDGWNREMDDFAEVDFCLNLDCPEEVMEARLLKRGETSGRTDDNAEAIKKRFQTFVSSTQPVIAIFAEQGKKREVSAADSVETVWGEIERIFSAVQWHA